MRIENTERITCPICNAQNRSRKTNNAYVENDKPVLTDDTEL